MPDLSDPVHKLIESLGLSSEEAQVGTQLQHPNIVPIHEIGTLPDGRYYFTMKKVQGTEFGKHIWAVHNESGEDRWRPAENGTPCYKSPEQAIEHYTQAIGEFQDLLANAT